MIEVLLVLEIFLTEDSQVQDLLRGARSCSEACLFFSVDLLCLWLQSVQYNLQHDFAQVTDEAHRSVVLALLQVTFHAHNMYLDKKLQMLLCRWCFEWNIATFTVRHYNAK